MVVCQLSHDVIGYEDSLSVIGVFNFDPFIVTVKDVQSPINNILLKSNCQFSSRSLVVSLISSLIIVV